VQVSLIHERRGHRERLVANESAPAGDREQVDNIGRYPVYTVIYTAD